MNSTLRKNQSCPIHQSFFCCGRSARGETRPAGRKPKQHVERVEDASLPRGYRELCSKPELRRRLEEILRKPDPTCALCFEPFTDYRDIELDHKEPKGMGGARQDDHRENLQAVHRKCNAEKGSRRLNPNRQSMDQLRDEFHALECPVCTQPKRDGHALCHGCYHQLPPQLQHDLFRMSGHFSGSYSYPDAVADAKDFLRSQTALKAIQESAKETSCEQTQEQNS